jgi:alkanesulfonate monooxygenase SsuD/methylene tetrahydromethanopterin reductase-like flavin-dependent oxidoreductase (luciferase family)
MMTTALLTGDVVIEDGRVVFEPGDFGEITYDEFGIPIARRPTVRPARIVLPPPQRELSPASYGVNTKEAKAIIAARKAAKSMPAGPFKQMSEMEKELREKLKEAQAHPDRASAKPNPRLAPVQILGRGGNNDPQERINQPSNETGLTAPKPDAPRAPAGIDYSRKK